jgi:hypothetical protein
MLHFVSIDAMIYPDKIGTGMLLQHPLSVLDEYMFAVKFVFFFNTLCQYSVLNSTYVQNMLYVIFIILILFSIK